MKIVISRKPEFAPGISWGYSNSNYLLSGMLINRVTGNAYGDEARRRVIEPLSLHGTSMAATSPTVPQPSGRAYSQLAENTTGKIYDVTEFDPSVSQHCGRDPR
ncbi:CubicO group peptidase (beta-lactamase class C family) [Streptomyces sp. SAI-144]|uniref:serine hydrolase domain-containing protein n=1 Tax=Streptomyces sp. SAI-144 TaxID=2940544 RepID=UPI002474DD68|nr:serine hydrolase domain-containing protein [Streptomyces sp. SAI-144]MDH6439440.1 CubicO group peptidase (beta-lactamase class C family) [Streptomyces sp. SAI-144]